MREIRIGTRGSLLAIEQTKIIADTISRVHPDIHVSIIKITTTGDRNLAPFSSDPSGIKGMFTLELERAILDGEIDFAVHSLKDLPVNPALPIVAYSRRGSPFDVLVGRAGKIGSSSLRRRLQVERMYPESEIMPVRGNITTRLKRLDDGEFSGLVLARAGLERLGLSGRISREFSPEEIMPAPGQGILACQGRIGGDYSYLDCVNDVDAMDCAIAERSFSRELGAGCNVPVGAYAEVDGESMRVKGLFVDGGRFLRGEISGLRSDAEELGKRLSGVIAE